MADAYGTYGASEKGSDPFLSASTAGGNKHKYLIYGVGGVTLIFVAVTIALLVIFAFTKDVFVHILFGALLALLCVSCGVLYRWRMKEDVDERFTYILLFHVLILVFATVVAQTYLWNVQAIDKTQPFVNPCDNSQLYHENVTPNGPNCFSCPAGYGVNTTLDPVTMNPDLTCGQFVIVVNNDTNTTNTTNTTNITLSYSAPIGSIQDQNGNSFPIDAAENPTAAKQKKEIGLKGELKDLQEGLEKIDNEVQGAA